jgi:hypothetical protein
MESMLLPLTPKNQTTIINKKSVNLKGFKTRLLKVFLVFSFYEKDFSMKNIFPPW